MWGRDRLVPARSSLEQMPPRQMPRREVRRAWVSPSAAAGVQQKRFFIKIKKRKQSGNMKEGRRAQQGHGAAPLGDTGQ